MKTLKHPVFKSDEVIVEDNELQDWLDQGWLESGQRRKPEAKKAPVADEPDLAPPSPATAE